MDQRELCNLPYPPFLLLHALQNVTEEYALTGLNREVASATF